jgi:uncharacterized protein YjbJ (UPF0337 family)
VNGSKILHQIEGHDELIKIKNNYEKAKDKISEESKLEKFGLYR